MLLTPRTFAAITALLFLAACTALPPPPPAAPAPIAPRVAGLPAASCKSANGFPDPACTPGVPDPSVTQANIKTTICKSGFTATVRPPVSYTNGLKTQQIAEYGYTDTNPKDYEEDHFIPLELGGDPRDPKNLWPELGPSPNPKDSVEGKLKRLVCSGKMPLATARERIAANWKTAVP